MIQASLSDPAVLARFRTLDKVLSRAEASIEADRCYYCHDAPCTHACPAEIDVPAFIRAIAVGQPGRAAAIIQRENPLGMSCARVCPVEALCEADCVRTLEASGPVRIGLLQRAAMTAETVLTPPVSPMSSPWRVAVVGAGPAGMVIARLLSEQGVSVDIYDGAAVAGGLNETGIAAYKMLDDAAQQEVRQLLQHPAIRFIGRSLLGKALSLTRLRQQYDAVCLTIGLAGQRRLDIAGESLPGVQTAVSYIAALRRGERLPVGKTVVVIGGGMTAIDMAIQIRLLGAETVHICYRRGIEDMGASAHERQLARDQGVLIHPDLRPMEIRAGAGGRLLLTWQATQIAEKSGGQGQGKPECWEVDQVFVAIGQTLDRTGWEQDASLRSLALDAQGKIAVDASGRTNLPGVWAAGDCAGLSADLTVHAVADAKAVVRALLAQWEREMP